MTRPRLLDLYCGAGGAAMGYHQAGFTVVGVDIDPQPNYPFEFHQADALTYPLDGYDAIHASPPCQIHSASKRIWQNRDANTTHVDLVAATRTRLQAAGVPYIIENVEGAPLENPTTLCGDMFDLGVKRHRLFETSFFLWGTRPCRPDHPLFVASVFGGTALSRTPPGGWQAETGNFMQNRVHLTHEQASDAMGIDWMSRKELSQAIPPAYTEHIGRQLREVIQWQTPHEQ